MPEPIVVAFIAIAGGLIGALVQSILARSFERSKFIRDNRREVYQDFLTGLGALSAHPQTSVEYTRARALVAESRRRMALFGSRNVVQLTADLFQNTASFESPMDQYRLYQVILEMRRDSIGTDDRGIKVDLMGLVFASAHEKESK